MSQKSSNNAKARVQPRADRTVDPYLGATATDRRQMLERIGVASAAELFADIPAEFRAPELCLPPPLSEQELVQELRALASANRPASELVSFLGGGAYRHYVPSVVGHMLARAEFYTAYTPYQPEISQGTLQSAFEFQSMVCELTGMDVANVGLYDAASAFAEACLMAVAATGRRRVAVLDTVHPSHIATLRTYASGRTLAVDVLTAGAPRLTEQHACLGIQQPNYFGFLEDVGALGEAARGAGAVYVVDADPISLGLFREPAAYGADVVTGSGQPLGGGLNVGGPQVGLFACRDRFLRQMPGRIVGRTHDLDGRAGYVLSLQTREQHIRRERATSNICTSQQLLALAAAVYLSLLGPRGLRQAAELCYHKAHYAAGRIAAIPGFRLASDAQFFKEFTVRCPRPVSEILAALLERGILGGARVVVPASPGPTSDDGTPREGLQVAVTEVNTRAEIDRLVAALSDAGGAT